MKPKGKVKDLQAEIVDAMKEWQKMEDASLPLRDVSSRERRTR